MFPLVLYPSLKPISWESVRSVGFYLDFLPEMLESWRPNPSWMDAAASVLLNLRGRQSGQGERAHSVTALNHDTKLQIPVIHLSQEIQSVALLQPHVFIPRSRLDSGWGGSLLKYDDLCMRPEWYMRTLLFLLLSVILFYFFQHLQKNSPRVKKHTWELNALCGGFTVLRNDEGGKKETRAGWAAFKRRARDDMCCFCIKAIPYQTHLGPPDSVDSRVYLSELTQTQTRELLTHNIRIVAHFYWIGMKFGPEQPRYSEETWSAGAWEQNQSIL